MPLDRLTRRRFVGIGATALAALPLSRTALGQAVAAPQRPARSRLILLGTAGGPTPKPNRAAPAQAILVGDHLYVVDCGNGVARQIVLAKLSLASIRGVFITHHHSDHNADYGNLLLLAWGSDLAKPVETFGPPPYAWPPGNGSRREDAGAFPFRTGRVPVPDRRDMTGRYYHENPHAHCLFQAARSSR